MNYLRNLIDSCPVCFKIVGILVLMFILYKFGYLFGKFIANMNL